MSYPKEQALKLIRDLGLIPIVRTFFNRRCGTRHRSGYRQRQWYCGNIVPKRLSHSGTGEKASCYRRI
jgi:hypothetical protein